MRACQRSWLNYKNDEVNRINSQNAAIKDQLHAQQQQAKQQQALVEQGKQIMSAENKGKATILDNGPALSAGGGATARLPTMARREVVAHQGEANCVAFSFNGARFCTGGADNRVKVWDTRSATVVTQLSGSTGSCASPVWLDIHVMRVRSVNYVGQFLLQRRIYCGRRVR